MEITHVPDIFSVHIPSYLENWTERLAVFGLIWLMLLGTVCTYQIVKGIVSYWLADFFALGTDISKYGDWAVVTGASAGIGKAYSMELSRRGLNIVMIGNNEKELRESANLVEQTHGKKTKIVLVDFSSTDTEGYQSHILDSLGDIKVGVLVNNVGTGHTGLFLENPPNSQKCLDLINTNMTACTMMVRLILPRMIADGKGIIVFVSSISGYNPTPGLALYSGTKAFIRFFSTALSEEYKSKGIIVQCVMPGPVDTQMVPKFIRDSPICINADVFVRGAVSQIGLRMSTFGHWKHAILIKFRKHIPGCNWFPKVKRQ